MIVIVLLLSLSFTSASAESSYPAPTTPDIVVENLERSLEELNAGEYEHLLDWSYLFEFAPEHEWMAPNGWRASQELDAIRRMLSGEPTRTGDVPRRVVEIEVDLEPITDWEETDEDPLGVLRTWRREYASEIVIRFDDGTATFIDRRQVLTVVASMSEADLELSEFRLLRWEEEESLRQRFGRIKARF